MEATRSIVVLYSHKAELRASWAAEKAAIASFRRAPAFSVETGSKTICYQSGVWALHDKSVLWEPIKPVLHSP